MDGGGGGGDSKSGIKRTNDADLAGRFYSWPSSRIVRVSRNSGGKDRHSKVLTSKGPRDRRVRLAVNTAIQFYDLQDRLGYDQPSKAVEWLLKAAEGSISDLPPMPNNPFPATPNYEERRSNGTSDHLALDDVCPASGEVGDRDGGGNNSNYLLHDQSSASTTETGNKVSPALSLLSRSEIRVKARERAKERALLAEKENKESSISQASSMTSSFTELLSSGLNNNDDSKSSPNGGGDGNSNLNESTFSFSKQSPTTTTPTMDYFTSSGLQMRVSSNPMFSMTPSESNGHSGELQQFSFVPDIHYRHHLAHGVNSCNESSNHGGRGHNVGTALNYTASSLSSPSASHACNNRGTLQSNYSSSSVFLPPQRFSSVDHGSPQSLFLAPMDCNGNGHYQFLLPGYEAAGRMQLFYGDPTTSHHGGNNNSSSNGSTGNEHSEAKGRN